MFQVLKTKSGIIVLRTYQHFDFFFFFCLFVCSDSEIKYLQCQHFKSWMVSSFCCFYCTVGPTEGLYCSFNKLQCAFSEQNFPPSPALLVSQGFYPKWLALLYTPSRTLCCLWWGSPANVRDNNLWEWAWCSQWNIHWEISLNALVLYI